MFSWLLAIAIVGFVGCLLSGLAVRTVARIFGYGRIFSRTRWHSRHDLRVLKRCEAFALIITAIIVATAAPPVRAKLCIWGEEIAASDRAWYSEARATCEKAGLVVSSAMHYRGLLHCKDPKTGRVYKTAP